MTALKTALAVLCMTLIIPLAIWGATGSFKHAMFAWGRYLRIMALIALPGVGLALIIAMLP